MQKINFQNLPNTTTPINATNLNQLQTNVETDIDNTNLKLIHGIKGSNVSYSTLDDFKVDLITNTYSSGSYLVGLNISGSIQTAIVQKANNNYLSFIRFSYGTTATQHKYNNGTWSEVSLG